MTDRPLIIDQHEARAFREGRQTQFRRVLKPQPTTGEDGLIWWHWSKYSGAAAIDHGKVSEIWYEHMPYAVGDRLWCRETALYWRHNLGPLAGQISHVAAYRADGYELEPGERWSPPNHMPRQCSRTTLTVTEVRVQPLQEISEADAIAQGVRPAVGGNWTGAEGQRGMTPAAAFALAWSSANPRDPWAANPWVAAYTVSVTLGNIDGGNGNG